MHLPPAAISNILGLTLLCLATGAAPSWGATRTQPHNSAASQPGLVLPPALIACNAADFQTLLHSAPAPTEAATLPNAPVRAVQQAVWLSANLLQWPGTEPSSNGRFRLYHATLGMPMPQPGEVVSTDFAAVALTLHPGPLPSRLAKRFQYLASGAVLSVSGFDSGRLRELHRQQLLLVHEDAAGTVLQAGAIQMAGALDDLYARAARTSDLGVSLTPQHVQFKLWAPTAQAVHVCLFDTAHAAAHTAPPMLLDPNTGIWRLRQAATLRPQYYTYLVDVWVPGEGLVRNRVTDPYSVSLNANSQRSYIADLNAAALKPADWDQHRTPTTVKTSTDMAIYELHVRDFSVNDDSVPLAHRGKYLAFTDQASRGMQHLRALASAGMTDVHLLPIFDIASVPESGCTHPP